MKHVIADIHCHPSMKPYGRSFYEKKQSADTNHNTSLFFYDPQTFWDKVKNKIAGVTNFRQTDFTALKYGGVNLVFCSLYPLEKAFFRANVGTGDTIDGGLDFVTGLGKDRINSIQDRNYGYFEDLLHEYEFLKQQDGKIFSIDGKQVQYKLVTSYTDIQLANVDQATMGENAPFVINVMLSIEGSHVFYSNFNEIGTDTHALRTNIFTNIDAVKNWPHRPLFITFSHHFWNGFAGHEISLSDPFVKLITNQRAHQTDTLNDLGREVLKKLLDNTDGKRILIDIKHMNVATRREYFALLQSPDYAGQKIPIIVSHGGVRGNDSNRHLFYDEPINFSDDEIVKVGETNGLFGIQLDERRIASKGEIKDFKGFTGRRAVLREATDLVWRQIQHIVEVLDSAGLEAWDIPCIGSDYDGIVNPVDGIWTSEDFKTLSDYLYNRAGKYVRSRAFKNLQLAKNKQINEEDIVYKIMGDNAYQFIVRNTGGA
jgi:microsomal dipeptidase-like Zn-dependent dipeptidase